MDMVPVQPPQSFNNQHTWSTCLCCAPLGFPTVDSNHLLGTVSTCVDAVNQLLPLEFITCSFFQYWWRNRAQFPFNSRSSKMPSFPPGEFKHSWGTAEKLYKSEVTRLKKGQREICLLPRLVFVWPMALENPPRHGAFKWDIVGQSMGEFPASRAGDV